MNAKDLQRYTHSIKFSMKIVNPVPNNENNEKVCSGMAWVRFKVKTITAHIVCVTFSYKSQEFGLLEIVEEVF